MRLQPLVGALMLRDRCVECDHVVVAITRLALDAAILDHIAYVNKILDRKTDIHFALQRLTALCETP